MRSLPLVSARGQRGKILWQDESLDVNQDDYEAIAEPITNTTRYNAFTYGFKDFQSKMICLTSACDKGNQFFDRFMHTLKGMAKGERGCFACAFDYLAAVANGITDMEFFEKERKRMPESTFAMEYGAIFQGSLSNSAFPYELIDRCRTLKAVELQQPKNSKSNYIIGLDIATSAAKGADNSVIVVEKYTEQSDGTYGRKLVYMRSFHGESLDVLAEEIRRLYHTKFPNTSMIVYDARGLGDSFDRFLEGEWTDKDTGKAYPPMVVDDKPSANSEALRVLHPFRAVQSLNQRIYTSMRVALEKQSLELPISYRIMQMLDAEEENQNKKLTEYEKAIFLEADALQHEMGNIVAKRSPSGNVLYDVPRATMHKDRYSALAMANDYITELENENIKRFQHVTTCIGIVDTI